MKLAFSKMEGAGNDFVVIDDREGALAGREEELAQKLCPRRTSVGADGLILVRAAAAELECDGEMDYYNADGSYSGMCGNGIRCTALFLRERWNVESADLRIAVAGQRALAVVNDHEVITRAFHLAECEFHRFACPLYSGGCPTKCMNVGSDILSAKSSIVWLCSLK